MKQAAVHKHRTPNMSHLFKIVQSNINSDVAQAALELTESIRLIHIHMLQALQNEYMNGEQGTMSDERWTV